jgi:protein-disulfide isomerase
MAPHIIETLDAKRVAMTSRIEIVTHLATLGVALLMLGILVWDRFDSQHERATRSGQQVEDVSNLKTAVSIDERRRGAGQVAIVEYSDFECPFCGTYAQTIYPEVGHRYVDPGRVQYIFRNFPIDRSHPEALGAAEAGMCAFEQGKFWDLHDALFKHQSDLSRPNLTRYASDAGVKSDVFEACMLRGEADRVRHERAEGIRLGVKSTPTFLLGYLEPGGRSIDITKRINGMLTFDAFSEQIDHLSKSSASRRDRASRDKG